VVRVRAKRACHPIRASTCAAERAHVRPSTCATATSPAAGGVRGVSPRQSPSDDAARFRRRRAKYHRSPAPARPRRPQGGFGGSPPDKPSCDPLLPLTGALSALA
jgi:hypothetical protein